jgi:predicted O-methyltransferase YrrM
VTAPLRGLAKAIRGSGTRKTRFHNERGLLMPPSAWARLPIVVLRRLLGRGGASPWIVPAASDFLDTVVARDWQALEVGAGASTTWLARRVGHVTSFEDDRLWYEEVRSSLEANGLDNVDLRRIELGDLVAAVGALPGGYDLVLVDHSEDEEGQRVATVEAAHEKVRPGGYLVLDDSDRRAYRKVDELLAGWTMRRFMGVRPSPLIATETTVFQRTAG